MALGGFEWVLIALAFFMLFGARRIPELARGIGQGINEFRKTSNSITYEPERGQQEIAKSVKYEHKEREETDVSTD